MLELTQPAGAFARIERWLAEAGFFDDPGSPERAQLFLGYALSERLRRRTTPPRIDPSGLPIAACRLLPGEPTSGGDVGRFEVGAFESTWTRSRYKDAIKRVRTAIAAGDVYQVNLVQHLSASFGGDPNGLAQALTELEPRAPAPFITPQWSIVSASPETFLTRRGEVVATMPIKGTRPLEHTSDFSGATKDRAEHVMIVDLERNDLSRVCVPGSVTWPTLMEERALAGVRHLESRVEGRLRSGTGLGDLLEAVFPGGSITGAPKIAAIDLIAELEPVGRGASMGALGTISPNGDLDLSLTIRTFAISDGQIHLWAGGGIVWDSHPSAEVEESWVKARPLLNTLRCPTPELALP